MSTMLVHSLIRSIAGLRDVGMDLACTRGSLRVQMNERGQSKFSFVGKSETVEFLVEVADLIQLALGGALLVSGPGGTLTMSRTSKAVHLQVQQQESRPVDFEMPLEKFGELLTSLVEEGRPASDPAPAVYLN